MMLTLGFLISTALAGSYYHPRDVAAASKVYGSATDAVAPEYAKRSEQSEAFANGLRRYEVALDLLGDRASAEDREHLKALRTRFLRQQAVLRDFASQMLADYDAVFSASLDTALKGVPGAESCGKTKIVKSPGKPARQVPNEQCQGEALNAALAAKMDQDPALAKAVAEISARTWPNFDLPPSARAPIGGADRWIDADRFFGSIAAEKLKVIQRDDDKERRAFPYDLKKISAEERARFTEQSREITSATAAKRAALAGPILATAEPLLEKWAKKDKATTGWCAVPSVFGGCTGEDATDELSARLVADKRMQPVLP